MKYSVCSVHANDKPLLVLRQAGTGPFFPPFPPPASLEVVQPHNRRHQVHQHFH